MIKHTPQVVLIGGTGRSGTNITKKILEQNSHVYCLPFEYRFTLDPDGILDFYTSFSSQWSPYFADVKIKRLEEYLIKLGKRKKTAHFFGEIIKKIDKTGKKITPDCYHGWELQKWFPNYESHVHTLISELKSFEYEACWPGAEPYHMHNIMYFSTFKNKQVLTEIFGKFLNHLIYDLLHEKQKDFFIEDNTWNILYANELFDLLPGAKLLHVIRDPRDVIASMRNQRWTPSDVEQTTIYYQELMNRWRDLRSHLPKERYLVIKLEDLTAHPDKVINKICTFSAIPFEKDMMSVDLSKSHSGRWKKELTDNQQRFITTSLSEILQEFNYG